MTKDEYRQHMRKYARATAVMSFVVVKNPDYQVLLAAGYEIIPFLLEDLLDEAWHCNSCWGEGYEFVPTWQAEWDADKTYPRSTGNVCPECGGKGNISSWGAMYLLFEKTRAINDAPVVEDWMRGRHAVLTNLWRKWGEKRGYLPVTPDEPEEINLGTALWLSFLDLFH